MACFIVPMVLAIATTGIQLSARNLAQKLKLSLLNALLWGGVILLAVEHVWHGEVTPWPPYLTAMPPRRHRHNAGLDGYNRHINGRSCIRHLAYNTCNNHADDKKNLSYRRVKSTQQTTNDTKLTKTAKKTERRFKPPFFPFSFSSL